ncbi:hypothetical protein [Planctomicrobium sp. SH527]|uniref:hypothetical protein n=1 Tax=Planctomicrobium sp. SH527 TaxID=3448123 RepID=UPI003F5B13DD
MESYLDRPQFKDASPGMKVQRNIATPAVLTLASLFVVGSLCGCQTNIGGQTLPSAYYLRDDVQYFPAGPDYLLPQTVNAHREYRAQVAGDAEVSE